MASWAPILAASLPALAAVLIYVLSQRQVALERKRRACAEAISDALSWLELPYRIRRRTDDTDDTLRSLAERIHNLQERLLFHENWLRVEIPQTSQQYRDLVQRVKKKAGPAMQDAWKASPVASANAMNIGDLGMGSVDNLVLAFTERVRSQLALWRVWS